MVYIVMGVSGCGKTTIGQLLSSKLAVPFFDADDFHNKKNIEKMHCGVALSDIDRIPWLNTLAENITQWNRCGDAVLACSALKDSYRQQLTSFGKQEVSFIFLKVPHDDLISRIKNRNEHFFPVELLYSQFAILEYPNDAFIVDANATPDKICETIIRNINIGRFCG